MACWWTAGCTTWARQSWGAFGGRRVSCGVVLAWPAWAKWRSAVPRPLAPSPWADARPRWRSPDGGTAFVATSPTPSRSRPENETRHRGDTTGEQQILRPPIVRTAVPTPGCRTTGGSAVTDAIRTATRTGCSRTRWGRLVRDAQAGAVAQARAARVPSADRRGHGLETQLRHRWRRRARDQITAAQTGDLAAYLQSLALARLPPVLGETSGGRARDGFPRPGVLLPRTAGLHVRQDVRRGRGRVGTGPSTPSLQGVSQTGPYFHDGRARTLSDVFDKHRHGLGESPGPI